MDRNLKIRMSLRYNNCCGCFTAKTGALILAILGIFSGGTGLISDSIGYGVYMPAVEEQLDQVKEQILDQYQEAGQPEEQKAMVEQYLYVIDVTKEALPYMFIGQIVSSALTLLIAAMLAYGITSGKKAFMLPWLISHFFCLVVRSVYLDLKESTADRSASYEAVSKAEKNG